jgi:hypothetical protein
MEVLLCHINGLHHVLDYTQCLITTNFVWNDMVLCVLEQDRVCACLSSHLLEKAFHHIFLSHVFRWFVNEVDLYVALALYLWENRNFDWIFEHLL